MRRKNVQKTKQEIKKEKNPANQSTIPSYFPNASDSSPNRSNPIEFPVVFHSFSGDEFLSDGEEFVPEFISSLIPTDGIFWNLKFATIPVNP